MGRVVSKVEELGRVHVIGGMGTGKTWLARRAGRVLGLPVLELDSGGNLTSTLSEDRWLTEGIYLWDVERVLDAADTVVWLDLPFRTALRRIVTRHIWLSVRGQNPHRGLRQLWQFALASGRYWSTAIPRPPRDATDWEALSRAQTMVVPEPYGEKVTRLSSRSEVTAWLGSLRRTTRPGGRLNASL